MSHFITLHSFQEIYSWSVLCHRQGPQVEDGGWNNDLTRRLLTSEKHPNKTRTTHNKQYNKQRTGAAEIPYNREENSRGTGTYLLLLGKEK